MVSAAILCNVFRQNNSPGQIEEIREISPPKVGFVIIRFHPFFAVFFPVFTTLNISSSLIPLTFGNGTLNFAAFSFRFSLILLLNAFASLPFPLSSRYCGNGWEEGSEGADDLTVFSSCARICLRIWIFSACRAFWWSFARRPRRFWAEAEAAWVERAMRLRVRSSWSSLWEVWLGGCAVDEEGGGHTACHAAFASARCVWGG